MKKKKRKLSDKPVFDSIRKPTAPPSQKFGEERPKEKADPVQRKAKHKKRTVPTDTDSDVY